MLRATAIVRKAAVKPERVVDTAWLDRKGRESRRVALKSHGGLEFLLDLDGAAVLNDGDAVKLEDGRLIQIMAAPEPVIEIRAENPQRLMRFAWQLGGRHVPAEITAEAIYVEDNQGLAELARGQGCRVARIMRAFQPERADEHACEHHDHHHHDHRHAHGHDHDRHGDAHGQGHKHEH